MAVSEAQFERIKELAKDYGATRLILFGSAVENPDTARDIDLACDGVEGWKLFEFAARLEEELHKSRDRFVFL
jgi:predicted nucleotidyltransferase